MLASGDPSVTPKSYPLGVLFVHGIGQQTRGGTLVQFGDPLCEFLSRWSGSEFTLEDCDLTPESPTPAHGEVNNDARWLLAECHWADAFHEPTFTDLMKWAFVGIPWVLGAHFNTHIVLGIRHWYHARRRQAIARFARAVWSSVVGALLVALVAGVFPLLLLFAVVPVLRPAVVGLQRLIAAVLGDSYLFVESPVQQAAIVSHFRRDLSWLLERTQRLVVVAHSQGAAVAYFGLNGWIPSKQVERLSLVTFGSGLPKLQTLRGARMMRRNEEHGGFFAWTAPLGLLVLSGAAYLVTGTGWERIGPALVLLALGVLVLFAGSLMTAGVTSVLRPAAGGGLLDVAEWTDVSATRDLVSNTSLGEFYETGDSREDIQKLLGLTRVPSKEHIRIVENFRSRLGDHVSYLKNSDGFLPIVVAVLLRTAGQTLKHTTQAWRLPDSEDVTRRRLIRAAERRRWRVLWRAGVTVAWAAATAALLVRRSASFPVDVVGGVRDRLSTLDPGDFTLLVSPVKRAIVALPAGFTGAVSICLVAAVLLLALRIAWLAWDASDRWRFFEGEDYTLSVEFWVYAVLSVVSVTTLALVSAGWTVSPVQFVMVPLAVAVGFDAVIGLLRRSRPSGGFLSESDKRLYAALAYGAAAWVVCWPIFAGLLRAGVDAAIAKGWSLPAVSSNPAEFWIGLLLGVPIWGAIRIWGRRGIARLQEWSRSTPSASRSPGA